MMTVYNLTINEIGDHVDGTLIKVPGKGSATTTEKKAAKLVEAYPGKLSLIPPAVYTETEFALIEKLAIHDPAKAAIVLLMRGGKLDVAAMVQQYGCYGTGALLLGNCGGGAAKTEPVNEMINPEVVSKK